MGFAELVRDARSDPPRVAVVLGSGMGSVSGAMTRQASVPFADVPGLPSTTVVGHGGHLTLGSWAGCRVLLFEGRVHYYEGHPWDTVVRPVEVAVALGVRSLILTNAAGGIHPDLGPGSFMAICDHLEWTRPNPWKHPGPGERPSPYSPRLLHLVTETATTLAIPMLPGVYAMLTGPSYETPAEIRALAACGADAVGMSTAREAQRARELGLEVAAISCITNRAAGLAGNPLAHEEVILTARAQAGRLAELIAAVLPRLTAPK